MYLTYWREKVQTKPLFFAKLLNVKNLIELRGVEGRGFGIIRRGDQGNWYA